jgi:ornithine cyclodeaminase/alanine dehydrogenase-like protein (mu-crystallin family)
MGEGAFAREGIVGEIGEVAAGTVPGRTGDTQITLFKSLGVVAQDLYAARAVLQRALAQGQGVTVPF